MAPDELQQAWQAQSPQARITIARDVLLREVRNSQEEFQATIFWRDFREIGVAVVMLPVWFWLGLAFSLPWSWYLAIPAFLWVAAFMVWDRLRHRRTTGGPGDPLLASARQSLADVEHQIDLLRNIFWWYLLPFLVPILSFFADVAWRRADDWTEGLSIFVFPSAFVLALYYLLYRMNQSAVQLNLEPRRQELQSLIASLDDQAPQEPAATVATEPSTKPAWGRRLLVATCLAIVVVYATVAAFQLIRGRTEGVGYPRLSPFAAVRWQDSQAEVKVDGAWYALVSLDDVPAEEIVAFSQKTFGTRWQKRFEEDLVELLTRMGYPPRDHRVKLVLRSLDSGETRILEDVPMTQTNRSKIVRATEAKREKKD